MYRIHLGLENGEILNPNPTFSRCFRVINQNGSGQLTFTEFLVGLWNLCSHSEEGILKFTFQLFDSKNTGQISYKTLKEFVKCGYGPDDYVGVTLAHMRKHLSISDSDVKNKNDIWIRVSDLQRVANQHGSLFLPLYNLQIQFRGEFFGERYWSPRIAKRENDEFATELRDLLHLNSKFTKLSLASGRPLTNEPE